MGPGSWKGWISSIRWCVIILNIVSNVVLIWIEYTIKSRAGNSCPRRPSWWRFSEIQRGKRISSWKAVMIYFQFFLCYRKPCKGLDGTSVNPSLLGWPNIYNGMTDSTWALQTGHSFFREDSTARYKHGLNKFFSSYQHTTTLSKLTSKEGGHMVWWQVPPSL